MENLKNAGRKQTSVGRYAAELGIPVRRLTRLGGEVRLRAMSEEARAVLLRPGNSRDYYAHIPSRAERVA